MKILRKFPIFHISYFPPQQSCCQILLFPGKRKRSTAFVSMQGMRICACVSPDSSSDSSSGSSSVLVLPTSCVDKKNHTVKVDLCKQRSIRGYGRINQAGIFVSEPRSQRSPVRHAKNDPFRILETVFSVHCLDKMRIISQSLIAAQILQRFRLQIAMKKDAIQSCESGMVV